MASPRALLAAGLSVAAVLLGTAAPHAGAIPAEPSPPPPPLSEVFNGYVVGTLREGSIAAPETIFEALTATDPFYAEPPLPADATPGTILKAKPVQVLFTGFQPANLTAFKLMYVTTGLDGVTPVISTGILMIPRDGTPPAERKLVAYQEANDSVGAHCHPSTQWTGGAPLDGAAWSALGPLALLFGKGYAVMISDVGNDADPTPHGVFAGKFAAHTLLDGARAAVSLPEAELGPDTQIAIFGIAGGGVGAGFAAEKAAEYAPELNVKSVVLEGMVVVPRNFLRVADGSVGSGFAFATLLGLEPWYPEMRVDSVLTPAGQGLANIYRTQCQTPAYFSLPFVPLAALFANGIAPVDQPTFQHAFDDNVLGAGPAPRAKVLITSCARDDSPMSLVPAADSRDLADRWAAAGTDVTYAPSDCSMITALTDLYQWGADLFGMQTVDWLSRNFD
ncbi:lipase family protein [Nocardia sp. NPDC048505]|uniref:lipase family protein n=1 Tax=unclassified Nocardia TaxID=2637762 RepID=UPI0033F778D3